MCNEETHRAKDRNYVASRLRRLVLRRFQLGWRESSSGVLFRENVNFRRAARVTQAQDPQCVEPGNYWLRTFRYAAMPVPQGNGKALLILLDDSVHMRGPRKEEHGPRARGDGTAAGFLPHIYPAIHVRDHARRGSHGTHAMRPCCGTRSRDPQASAACMWRELALSAHVWPMPCMFCVSQRQHAPWLRAQGAARAILRPMDASRMLTAASLFTPAC